MGSRHARTPRDAPPRAVARKDDVVPSPRRMSESPSHPRRTGAGGGREAYLPLSGLVDVAKEVKRLTAQVGRWVRAPFLLLLLLRARLSSGW